MTTTQVDDVTARATELARTDVPLPEAVEALVAAAGGDRAWVEAARDHVAARVHVRVDDFEATATLRLLNRVLSKVPVQDPLDWRWRLGHRLHRP